MRQNLPLCGIAVLKLQLNVRRNLRTHQIFDIETVDVEVGSLDYQYVTIYGKEFAALNANEEDDIDSSTDYWFE